MAFARPKARILERSITAGNGPYALAGAVDGSYNTFASFMAVGDSTEASVVEPGVAFWTGIVTYTAPNQITLTTVEESKGAFGSGTKEIFAGGLASRGVLREDISGAIVTGGTSTAYTIASFRGYDTLVRLNGKTIAFTPHARNTGPATLNVDGLGSKPLLAAPGVELFPATLLAGTPYLALYNNTDGAFYLHGLFGNPAGVPIGAGMDYWGPIAPSTNFAFPIGQAVSRLTYASLFSGNPWSIGTTFGSGDGVNTFNLPDKRGRVSQASDSMGGFASGRSVIGYGQAGGSQYKTIGSSDLPNRNLYVSVAGSVSGTLGATRSDIDIGITTYFAQGGGAPIPIVGGQGSISVAGTMSGSMAGETESLNGGVAQTAMSLLQPTIGCNYIMRVL